MNSPWKIHWLTPWRQQRALAMRELPQDFFMNSYLRNVAQRH